MTYTDDYATWKAKNPSPPRVPQIGDEYTWRSGDIYRIVEFNGVVWRLSNVASGWSEWFDAEQFNRWENNRLPQKLAEPAPASDAVTVDYVTAQATKIIEASEDVVNQPSHYKFANGVEVIALTEQLNFNCGNVVKYTARAGRKDASKQLEDLRKAEFYIKREIARVENLGEDL